MDSVIESMCKSEGLETESTKTLWSGRCPLYVVTNENQSYGARAILRKDLLRDFAERQGKDFYILPSSVHELIFVEDDGELDAENLKKMVYEVNRQPGTVAPEECLADSVYYCNRERDYVEIVA